MNKPAIEIKFEGPVGQQNPAHKAKEEMMDLLFLVANDLGCGVKDPERREAAFSSLVPRDALVDALFAEQPCMQQFLDRADVHGNAGRELKALIQRRERALLRNQVESAPELPPETAKTSVQQELEAQRKSYITGLEINNNGVEEIIAKAVSQGQKPEAPLPKLPYYRNGAVGIITALKVAKAFNRIPNRDETQSILGQVFDQVGRDEAEVVRNAAFRQELEREEVKRGRRPRASADLFANKACQSWLSNSRPANYPRK